MSYAARKHAAAISYIEPASAPAAMSKGASRGSNAPVFLITQDDALWPQIGPGLERDGALRQVDSVEELQRRANSNEAAILIWDARESADRAAELDSLQRLSARFAILVLDIDANAESWRKALQQQRIVAFEALPVDAARLLAAFGKAREDYQSGDLVAGVVPVRHTRIRFWIAAAVCIAGGAAYFIHRHPTAAPEPRIATALSGAGAASAAAASAVGDESGESVVASDEEVDSLLEKARQAMTERHFIEPAGENALSLYQNVLIYDPDNGEAHQALTRLAQILYARVESDLNERKFDLALESLETARGINPGDPRLASLDARFESLRAGLGSAQIQAAINAKNFERATQLLDEAARAQSLRSDDLNQLREAIRQRQQEADIARSMTFFALRMHQDRLLSPAKDSAAYYLAQARENGANADQLRDPSQAFVKKLLQSVRSSLDAHLLTDVEPMLDEARAAGATAKTTVALRRDFDAERDRQSHERLVHVELLELAKKRLAQGALVEPANDSALFYVTQLRGGGPADTALTEISEGLQKTLIAAARTAIDADDTGKAELLVTSAKSLGPSAVLDEVSDALEQQKLKAAREAALASTAPVPLKPLKLDYPRAALAAGTEGWVDLAFDVSAEGKVGNIHVVDAAPPNVFEAAAKHAVSRVRYKPMVMDGHALKISTTLHVVFRLDQQQ